VAQSGWYLTVANVGDSRAVVDTGAETVLLTEDHRVATHQGERRRLDAMGAVIAPIDISGAPRWALPFLPRKYAGEDAEEQLLLRRSDFRGSCRAPTEPERAKTCPDTE
jgi:hypothetical protein